MAAADSLEYLNEIKEDIIEDFGKIPREVANLFRVIELKILAKRAGLTVIKAENIHMKTGKEIILYMGKNVKPANIVYTLEHNPRWQITSNKMRIKLEHLGLNWFDELKICVTMLGDAVDRAKIEENNNTVKSAVEIKK